MCVCMYIYVLSHVVFCSSCTLTCFAFFYSFLSMFYFLPWCTSQKDPQIKYRLGYELNVRIL